MAEVAKTTPKRKRGSGLECTPWAFSFDPSFSGNQEDGSKSPRSVVAHRFSGLAIESGGGVPGDGEIEDVGMEVEADDALRKRRKPDEEMKDSLQLEPQPEPETSWPLSGKEGPAAPVLQLEVPSPSSEGSLQKSYPSINRLSESKSRKKRSGTPPLRIKKGQSQRFVTTDVDVDIVDPVRAALTWHEDEITIYDPNDEDDDGTGINGVGFKPTPALAHARVMKRRQQMAEYRKREENEARAKRSQRRRGEGGLSARREATSPAARRVRFMDAGHRNITITTV